ncbi:MAG: MerR family transcriptional regulator [Eubacteriales bacterium]|nr:MerR family transcriptional regulator [Eubacteriales bacterium]
MLFENNKLFTIGQFAAMHEINKKTLMWYDEIGLLKPACIKENGYRYYSYQQSSALEIILMLRELDVSLDTIKEFMEHRTISNFENILQNELTELEHKIAHMKSIHKILSSHQQDMKMIRSLDLSEIQLIKKTGHYLVTVDTDISLSLEKDVDKLISETKKYQLHRLHDASYGSMIPVENLYQNRFNEYTALYIELPYPVSKKGLHFQPAGTYLRAFCKGSWDKIPNRYKDILEYANKHNLTFCGYAYEKGINEIVVDKIDDYITQIEIQVK